MDGWLVGSVSLCEYHKIKTLTSGILNKVCVRISGVWSLTSLMLILTVALLDSTGWPWSVADTRRLYNSVFSRSSRLFFDNSPVTLFKAKAPGV